MLSVYVGFMDFWIPLFGSALGGAFVTGIFGFVKNRQDKVTEHAQWLRNQKVEVYADLIRHVTARIDALDNLSLGHPAKDASLEVMAGIVNARLMFIGSKEVESYTYVHLADISNALDHFGEDTYEQARWQVHASMLQLLELIRQDLSVVKQELDVDKKRFWRRNR
jgi:hypothetical protein